MDLYQYSVDDSFSTFKKMGGKSSKLSYNIGISRTYYLYLGCSLGYVWYHCTTYFCGVVNITIESSRQIICDFYTSTKILSMVVCSFQFSYHVFVFPLIFIYHLVYLQELITVQFIDTIAFSQIFHYNVARCCSRVDKFNPV